MFIARQPIFNRSMKVYGYELLYRDSKESKTFKNSHSAERATATVLGGLFELGINSISNNKISFVNFNYDFLLSDSIELINPENLIIEILEDTHVDNKLIKRLKDLKQKGYKIALDDFVESYEDFPLVPLADIIKYDIIATPLESIGCEVNRANRDRKILLAEKVETKEEYDLAKNMGFHLFQGYFFDKPIIIGKSNDKKSIKFSYIKLITELNKPEPSYDRMAEIIRRDVNMSYRLLSLVKQNNPESKDALYTIKESLVYMGLRQIERWLNILMLQDLSTDKPVELTRTSIIRSKFGESVAKESRLKSRSAEIYTMLLFSTLDAILDQPMEKALEDISITEDMRNALIYWKGDLSPMLNLIYAYERGEWIKVRLLCEDLNIQENQVTENYIKALEYSDEIMNITRRNIY